MGTQVQSKGKEKAEKAVILPSRYGHRQSSMSGRIDDLVWNGTTLENAAKVLSKEFGKPEAMTAAKFRAHINWLPKVRGVEVEVNKAGVYKTKVAHATAELMAFKPFAGKAKEAKPKAAKAPKAKATKKVNGKAKAEKATVQPAA
jgi:hypothetical protein